MIFPELKIDILSNKIYSFTGIDTLSEAFDKKRFKNYPYPIEYRYNSRGFRDTEWPESVDELKNCYWCFGDSFTSGVGSPLEHTWPYLLQQQTGTRCINISLDGASNDWIARNARHVISQLAPAAVFVQWSYLQRGESENSLLPDNERRIYDKHMSLEKQLNNFIENFNSVDKAASDSGTLLCHSMIPQSQISTSNEEAQSLWDIVRGSDWPKEFPKTTSELLELPPKILSELKNSYLHAYDSVSNAIFRLARPDDFDLIKHVQEDRKNFISYQQIDLARDGWHYDIKTATKVVEQFLMLLNYD